MRETRLQSLGWEYPLEKAMATHSSSLAWKSHGWRSLVGYSPWGSQRVGHDWATSLSLSVGFLYLRWPGATLYLRRTGFSWWLLSLLSTGSVVAAHGLSCPMPCEIFPGQGLNPYPLHWQADSYPLDHQGHSFAFSAVGVLWIQSILISRHCLGQFRLL